MGEFFTEATRGRLFFTRSRGRINRLYQRMLGRRGQHWDHVGVIGRSRAAYESTFWGRGPSRNRRVDRYLDGKHEILIVDAGLTPEQIDRGMEALTEYIFQARGYDWLSLITCGLVQLNRHAICSELAAVYLNAALQRPMTDCLVLPDDFLAMEGMTPCFRFEI